MADISKMIDQYRSKRPFVMNLTTFDETTIGNDLGTNIHPMFDAVPASTAMAPIITNRKMSLMEYTRTRGKKKHDLMITLKDMILLQCHVQIMPTTRTLVIHITNYLM